MLNPRTHYGWNWNQVANHLVWNKPFHHNVIIGKVVKVVCYIEFPIQIRPFACYRAQLTRIFGISLY